MCVYVSFPHLSPPTHCTFPHSNSAHLTLHQSHTLWTTDGLPHAPILPHLTLASQLSFWQHVLIPFFFISYFPPTSYPFFNPLRSLLLGPIYQTIFQFQSPCCLLPTSIVAVQYFSIVYYFNKCSLVPPKTVLFIVSFTDTYSLTSH